MKKMLTVVVSLIAATMLLSSCGKNNPADIEMSIQKEFQKGNFEAGVDKFIANAAFENETKAQEMKAMLLSFKDKVAKQNETKGGLKEIVLVEETIDEAAGTAVVKTKKIYNDGSEEEGSTKYIKVDGKWKIDLDKN